MTANLFLLKIPLVIDILPTTVWRPHWQ
jgi:hypothetical protein